MARRSLGEEEGCQDLAWAMQIMWRMRYRGTKKVGIRLRGRVVIGAVVGP
jgi:hypothetical protein